MEKELQEFLNIIHIKNELINLTEEELKDTYKSNEDYYWFIKTLDTMTKQDDCFLLLESSFLDKIQEIIQNKRYDLVDKKYIELTNEIICQINSLRNYPEHKRNIKLNHYVLYHEEIRQLDFDNHEDFLHTLANDYIVYKKLIQDDVKDIDGAIFFGTTNYFLEFIPQLYEKSSNQEITKKKLNDTIKQKGIHHIFINRNMKRTINNFQKIKTIKGE